MPNMELVSSSWFIYYKAFGSQARDSGESCEEPHVMWRGDFHVSSGHIGVASNDAAHRCQGSPERHGVTEQDSPLPRAVTRRAPPESRCPGPSLEEKIREPLSRAVTRRENQRTAAAPHRHSKRNPEFPLPNPKNLL